MTDLPTRVADLRAVAMEHITEEPVAGFVWMVCDGCGMRVAVGHPPNVELVAGWKLNAHGPDLCPECR